jgi:hypothetical protein
MRHDRNGNTAHEVPIGWIVKRDELNVVGSSAGEEGERAETARGY